MSPPNEWPNEIIGLVFCHLTLREVVACGGVCRSFRAVASDFTVFRKGGFNPLNDAQWDEIADLPASPLIANWFPAPPFTATSSENSSLNHPAFNSIALSDVTTAELLLCKFCSDPHTRRELAESMAAKMMASEFTTLLCRLRDVTPGSPAYTTMLLALRDYNNQWKTGWFQYDHGPGTLIPMQQDSFLAQLHHEPPNNSDVQKKNHHLTAIFKAINAERIRQLESAYRFHLGNAVECISKSAWALIKQRIDRHISFRGTFKPSYRGAFVSGWEVVEGLVALFGFSPSLRKAFLSSGHDGVKKQIADHLQRMTGCIYAYKNPNMEEVRPTFELCSTNEDTANKIAECIVRAVCEYRPSLCADGEFFDWWMAFDPQGYRDYAGYLFHYNNGTVQTIYNETRPSTARDRASCTPSQRVTAKFPALPMRGALYVEQLMNEWSRIHPEEAAAIPHVAQAAPIK